MSDPHRLDLVRSEVTGVVWPPITASQNAPLILLLSGSSAASGLRLQCCVPDSFDSSPSSSNMPPGILRSSQGA